MAKNTDEQANSKNQTGRPIDKYMFLKPINGINVVLCGKNTQNIIEAIKLAKQKHGKNLDINGAVKFLNSAQFVQLLNIVWVDLFLAKNNSCFSDFS